MKRRVKDAVGYCRKCGSDAVLRHTNKGYADYPVYSIKKKYFSIVCSNPECRHSTCGYEDPKAALAAWVCDGNRARF